MCHGFAMPKITRGYIMTDLQSFWKEIQSPKRVPAFEATTKAASLEASTKTPGEKDVYIMYIYILLLYNQVGKNFYL